MWCPDIYIILGIFLRIWLSVLTLKCQNHSKTNYLPLWHEWQKHLTKHCKFDLYEYTTYFVQHMYKTSKTYSKFCIPQNLVTPPKIMCHFYSCNQNSCVEYVSCWYIWYSLPYLPLLYLCTLFLNPILYTYSLFTSSWSFASFLALLLPQKCEYEYLLLWIFLLCQKKNIYLHNHLERSIPII